MIDDTPDTLLQRFITLLREAQFAQDECDMFDLDSKNPESSKQFENLRKEAREASATLITFIRDNPEILNEIKDL